MVIPFALRIPDTAPPTAPGDRQWVDWVVRVEASLPGVDYAQEFRVPVLPADASVPVAAAPPRTMPELPPERLAERLGTAVETVGDVMVLRLPSPVPSTALLILLSLVTVAIAAPGMPWTTALDEQEARLGTAAVSGGLAVVMLLVLMLTTRRIEIRRQSVRLVRGLCGLGFHATIPARDVVAVEETSTPDPQAVAFYGVGLRTRQGTLYSTAMRLRDPAQAKALVHALESLLITGDGGRSLPRS